MKVFVSKPEQLLAEHLINSAHKTVLPPFPTVLTKVKVKMPTNVLLPRLTHRYYQIEAVWDTHRQVIRQPKADEEAKYFLKPSISGLCAKMLSFLAINEHLLISFAQQALGFPVLSTALVATTLGYGYHLLVTKADLSRFDNQVPGEQILMLRLLQRNRELNLTEQKPTEARLWEQFCEVLKQELPQTERLLFLKQVFFRFIIDSEIHPNHFGTLALGCKAILVPFADVIATGIYQKDYSDLGLMMGTPATVPADFSWLAHRMKINNAAFKQAAQDILYQWTYGLPDYIDKLQALTKGLPFELPFTSRETAARTWVTVFKQQQQQRIQQLDALGWYRHFEVPTPNTGYSMIQRDLFGL